MEIREQRRAEALGPPSCRFRLSAAGDASADQRWLAKALVRPIAIAEGWCFAIEGRATIEVAIGMGAAGHGVSQAELRKAAKRAYQREWYLKNRARIQARNAEHREERRAYKHGWYLAHREEILARDKACYADRRERKSTTWKTWRAANTERVRIQRSAYYAEHRERELARSKAWYLAHREEILARVSARYAAKRERERQSEQELAMAA
jgi:hypothetical protein